MLWYPGQSHAGARVLVATFASWENECVDVGLFLSEWRCHRFYAKTCRGFAELRTTSIVRLLSELFSIREITE